MRYFFLVVLLVTLVAGPVGAQRLSAATRPDSLLAAPPAPDTAAAIHRLFAAKRKRQGIISGATLVAALGVVAVATSSQQPSGGGGSSYGIITNTGPILDGSAVAVLTVGVIMLPVVSLEAVLFGGWNKKQEQQTIDAWQQHKEARFLKRKLKLKYFAAPPPAK